MPVQAFDYVVVGGGTAGAVVAARLSEDPGASVGLRVRGVAALRVADASAFPSLTTVNPMVAVLMLAERAADLIRSAAGPAS